MSKVEQAKKIVAANPNASRGELIEMFMSQLSMTKAGATTYFYNVGKVGKSAPKVSRVAIAAASKAMSSVKKTSKSNVNKAEVQAELDRINSELDKFEQENVKHKNGLTWSPVQEKNLDTMKKVSRRLAKDKREQAERENEVNDYIHGSSDSLTREDLRELGL
jgi:hypothetical protein